MFRTIKVLFKVIVYMLKKQKTLKQVKKLEKEGKEQEVKEKIFEKHGKSKTDTGSAEGQIALFTHRIEHLTKHLKANHKDHHYTANHT